MKSQCVQSIIDFAAQAGKNLNQSDLRDVEARITKHVNAIGNEIRAGNAQLAGMTPAERVMEAAERAAKEILRDKQVKAINVARQIIATSRNTALIDRIGAKLGSRVEALKRLIVTYPGSGNLGAKSLDQRKMELKGFYTARMVPFIKATEKYAGFWTDKGLIRDFVREVKGEDTGNADAKRFAKLWTDGVAEPMRRQANEAGSNIEKRGDWGLPQAGMHDPLKIAAAGRDAWVGDMMGWADRSQYSEPNGKPMSEQDLRTFLEHAYDPLSSNGVSEMKPGTYAASSIKGRGSHDRQLHFKDGDSYLAYQQKYGAGSLLQSLVNHVDRMATNTAAMETFGPNVESAFKYLVEDARQKDTNADRTQERKVAKEAKRAQAYFDVATGKVGEVENPTVAHAFENLRSILAMGKLAFAPLSALDDTVFLHLIANVNNIPQASAWLHELRTYNPFDSTEKDVMTRAGIGLETILHEMNRFGQDGMGHGVPATLANLMFRVNGLNKLDAARRRAVGAMMLHKAGDLAENYARIEDLPEDTERVMKNSGITQDNWDVWRAAQRDERGLLTPDAVLAARGNFTDKQRTAAAQALIGVAAKQSQFVVPLMTAKTAGDVQFAMGGPKRAGNVFDEFKHSALQFKSFSISSLANNFSMLMDQPSTRGKMRYGAAWLAGSLVMGALSVQLKQLAHGQNPGDMDPSTPEGKRFWVRALAQGGMFGLWGDLAAGPIADNKWDDMASMLGPIYDTANKLGKLAFTAGQAAFGAAKPGEVGKQATSLAKGVTPSTWYTNMVLDHLIFQQMQEYYSPGYNQRVQDRVNREMGSTAYWPRGAPPSQIQAPDLRTAVGAAQ